MDRRRARPLLLIAAAAVLGAAAAPSLPIRAARWLAPGTDPVDALGREPGECLVERDDPSVAIGRAAFRTPLVLGGQAARAGLSCNSCHINGHGNPAFHFPGLSGAAGTADVTASLMSRTRGDGTFNPKPIPSLYAAARLADRSPRGDALEHFIHGLVVDEFDAHEPPPSVLKGLADYVRALRPGCDAKPAPVTLAARAADAKAAARAAQLALGMGDRQGFRLMVGAARTSLGLIAERYPPAELPAAAAVLRTLDLELVAIRDSDDADARLAEWQGTLSMRLRPLAGREADSLFAHHRLAAHGAPPPRTIRNRR